MTQAKSLKKNKLIACIQARIGSTRLKRKALRKILGKTLIQIIKERLAACNDIDQIVLATADTPENNTLVQHAQGIGLPYYQGSEHDLISRYLGTMKKFKGDAFIRITADCPLIDPTIIDKLTKIYRTKPDDFDLISNIFKRTYPKGLDAEIIPLITLKKLNQKIKDPKYREIFPTYLMRHPESFRIYNLAQSKNLSDWRWTVDYPEDLAFVREIFKNLGGNKKIFTTTDILNLLNEKPEIVNININRIEN